MIIEAINFYIIGYPIILSVFWITGSLLNKLQTKYLEKEANKIEDEIEPSVAILVPGYNEELNIKAVVSSLNEIEYKNIIIYLIDDCSTDQTLKKMYELKEKYLGKQKIEVIALPANGGKAKALNYTLKLIETDYVVVIDADSMISSDSISYLVNRLESNPKLGAVTGRPIVRNRATMLARIQTMEYLGIIGNIKEAQNFFFNGIMTVSGVIVAYRTKALETISGFDEKTMTEDINATWKLYQNKWDVGYESRATTWILVPDTIRGLYRQRKRWAIGGLEVCIENMKKIRSFDWSKKMMLLENVASHVWSWLFIIATVNYFVNMIIFKDFKFNGNILLLFFVIGVLQFGMGQLFSQTDDKLTFRDKLVFPIYLLVYWLVNLVTSVASEYVVFLKGTDEGKWESSDRGL
ncbi:glycosyltransferase [Vagococcus coleopterorum]|uniref:Glycosyltransferase n=1 Tax=Vagococcus coleopterorum TaxID=2714946 RepID=A0A6G8AP94_9ENTE|nr:glycosyltransferase [Vagococcus coleopterorum]QIL46789.1 glycosyltransferase [Vagococcus coleopterorum]